MMRTHDTLSISQRTCSPWRALEAGVRVSREMFTKKKKISSVEKNVSEDIKLIDPQQLLWDLRHGTHDPATF